MLDKVYTYETNAVTNSYDNKSTALSISHKADGKEQFAQNIFKQVFAITFKEVEIGSIKSHLRDDEKKGKSLSDRQITE